eukprot:TRINITY_DN1539_c1_g2_i1.p1 TRINITY_DN1539_c1_g2~~TRINITY_DN1539_c1_g2_i1.p1  ORF type:complete len:451 (-),score=55.69 TRINITY_DN1539_c1_g2_i1:991-2193(-)
MFNMNNMTESAAFMTAPQAGSSTPLSCSPASSTPQYFNQVSQALAMSLLNDAPIGNMHNLADTWSVANKGPLNSVSPQFNQFTASPRGHSIPSVLPNAVLPSAGPSSPNLENIVSGSLPSFFDLQQYSSVTNTLINDLQLLNLGDTSINRNYSQPAFASSNIVNRNLQQNKPRDQNPRKVRQQEQFAANKQRTIYISEIPHEVTEADLAMVFSRCGDVVDCRLCGDAHSRMRFGFVEFSVETWTFAVPQSLKMNNMIMCGSPVRVQRSKTAIVPVKKELLPQSDDELVRTSRTIYACNIDKRFTKMDVQAYFEALVVDESIGADGKVARIKMMADSSQKTNIAFVEFCSDESVAYALAKCQGALMGCLPLRVFPSKTPIRTPEEERVLKEARAAAMFKRY